MNKKLSALQDLAAKRKSPNQIAIVESAFDPVRQQRAIDQKLRAVYRYKNGDTKINNPTNGNNYRVSLDSTTHSGTCNCPDCHYRKVACKHIIAAVQKKK